MDRKAKPAGVLLCRCLLCLVMIQALAAECFCGVEETKNLFAEKECYFRNISTTQGLSQSTVFCIQQDHLGFMWMGTQDGLNRFDGEEFKIFRNRKNDSTSFSSNYVRALFLDSHSNLWIGGDKGISRYSYEKQYFVNYSLPHAPGVWYVSAIAEGPDSAVYAATSSGELYKRGPGKALFAKEEIQWPRKGVTAIRSLLKHQDQLFIGTNEGLYVYDLRRKTCELLSLGENEPMINEVYVDIDVIWIGTEGRGLYRYGPQKGVFVNYVHKPGEQSVVTGNDVRSIRTDLNGNLWIGTFSGLTIWDTRLNSYRHYHQDPGQPYSMSHNSVRQIYRDRQGGMWLGTYFGGVSYYHPEHIKFNLLTQNRGKLSLTDQVINVISQDDRQNFWIGTNDKGISYWDRQQGTITGYSHTVSGTPIFRSNSIKAILQLGDGRLLVGTHNGGLNLFSPKNFANRVFLHTPDDTTTISGDMVYALLRDHRGEIWVGTRTGLDRFDLATQTFRRFASEHPEQSFSSRTVTFLLEDSRRYIWIGTTNGVTRISPDRKEVTAFPGDRFSNDVVTCLAYDQHHLWIGTRNGLNYMNPSTGQTGTVDTGDGILEGIISSIQPGEDGLLWISTNRGLVRYDPKTQKKQLFDTRDGLQNNQFILTSSCKASDGLMLFGGINGISYFYPAELRLLSFPLEIRLTALNVLGNEITAGHPFHILEKHINATSAFVLQPDHKQFSFHFNSFNYISPSRVTYFYYLEGYDTGWQVAERDRNASYHNLPPGQYTFHVKAVGPMGESSPEKTVRIKILPPWWKTYLFYFTSVLLAAAGIFFAYKSSTDRLKALHQLRIERMEHEKEAEINQMKLDFFTHISHELRTPLTLIKAPLDEIRSGQLNRFRLQKNYDLISRNTERLLALVNELLDFRKLDLKSGPGTPQRTDLIDLAGGIFQSFRLMAENKRISYSFEKQADAAYYLVDKGIFEKILVNLLSNALKYTPEGGKITLSLETLPEQLILKVADNGIGIDEIHQEQVFEPFFRVNEDGESAGSGIGLAFVKELVTSLDGRISLESVKNRGTVVTVTLPLKQEYSAAEPVSTAAEPANGVFISDVPNGILSKLALLSGEKKKNLLLVDDNPEITAYLKEYFEHQYHIATAASGSEALPLVERDLFDLILCDVMMPGVDGVTFCDRIKQDIRTCHIPIILLTAKAGISQQIVGIEAGADDYITKPFSIQLLESKISNIIKNRERLKQYHSRSEEIDPAKITMNPLDEALIRKVIAIVEARIEDPDFSVDKLSSEVGMSRSALYLKLRALTGESPSDLVRRIRLGYAARLLKTRQYNIAEVAFRSGFNSPAYFSTSFKQHYGCMPSEYSAGL
ncbi:MAG: hypothetical protein ABS46_20065 [Cytophagaceae bacterium SCN 52-12]|nr:MAG: hypothetical protein ABS46_20065 [Cytophagaceae bacterium SCN 52-12]